jgi:hypothetical protein
MGTTIFLDPSTMTLTPLDPYIGLFGIPTASMPLTPLTPSATWEIPADATNQRIFRCILTGSEDALDDLDLPMASFSAQVRNGDPTYLSCDIPNGSAYEAAILARVNGDIIIRYGVRLPDGTEQLVEIARVNYESSPSERSGSVDTISLIGHKTTTFNESKYWPISGLSYFTIDSEGKRRLRADIDFFLRPGDICQFDDDEMTVGEISYSVKANPAQAVMEVSEA